MLRAGHGHRFGGDANERAHGTQAWVIRYVTRSSHSSSGFTGRDSGTTDLLSASRLQAVRMSNASSLPE
jgi:hypothetical protein